MADPLEKAVGELGAARRRPGASPSPAALASDAAFRATVDERLSHLEEQVGELQRRINGLLFVLVGAVATNLVVGLTR